MGIEEDCLVEEVEEGGGWVLKEDGVVVLAGRWVEEVVEVG